jgi:hypothetical protein
MTTNIDIALLVSEWEGGGDDAPECPSCGASGAVHLYPRPRGDFAHEPGCAHDLALAERGYATAFERGAARQRIKNDAERAARASKPTLIPPASAACGKCGSPLATGEAEGCTPVSCLIKPPVVGSDG